MENWKIEYLERPLKPSRIRDLIHSGTTTHGFLRVVNDKSESVLELHGLYTKELGAAFNTVARILLGRPMHLSHLKVVALTNPHLMNVYHAHLPVTPKLAITGSEDTILRFAEAMVRGGDVINEKGFDYYLTPLRSAKQAGGSIDPGLNCKTVAAELLRPFVELTGERDGYAQNPTLRQDIATVDPALSAIHVDWDSPLDAVRLHLARGIREISPKHGKEHLLSYEPLKEKDRGTLAWLRTPECRWPTGLRQAPAPAA